MISLLEQFEQLTRPMNINLCANALSERDRLVVSSARFNLGRPKDSCRLDRLYGAVCYWLHSGFTPAGLRAPQLTPHARYPDSGTSSSQYATLLRRHISRTRMKWLTEEAARGYHGPVHTSYVEHSAGSASRQEPRFPRGFCRLEAA